MRVRISSAIVEQITTLAAASPEAEICGLLFGTGDAIDRAQPCPNAAADPARAFEIDPAALIAAHRAMRAGGARLIGHFHSHPNGQAMPSPRDAEAAAADGSIWLIAAAGGVTGWRAVADGPVEGRFEPLLLDRIASGCAERSRPPEGAQLKHLAGEASR
ncbi:M67 family metallopeptidase [Hephaestia mangrovi]|uniref:M67 family metallopeptidase n=1 Tax=Hephaestia mangrovi TaxID=2873268 RepID=UPI001CA6DB76|nr:M67 family metallopeptidase [Hephaestia mangrovi]MBY8827112.1 M67 family metallopeptidase [Hephaestia mangrovi]